MANEFACPACGATLRTAKPLPAGKRIKCPHCSETVAVPAADDGIRAAGSKSAPARGGDDPPRRGRDEEADRPRRKRDDDEDDRPRRSRDDDDDADDDDRPRKKKKKAKSGGKGLLIGLIVGGLLVLLGGGGVTAFLLLRSSNPLVGTWEANEFGMSVRTEFTSGGRMRTTANNPLFGANALTIEGSYKIQNGNTVEISVSEEDMKRAVDELQRGLPPALKAMVNPAMLRGNFAQKSLQSFRVEGNTLTLGRNQLTRVR